MSEPNTIKAVFILPPGVLLLDITGPAHIFYEAECYGAKVNLFFCSLYPNERDSKSSCDLSFAKLTPFDQLSLTEGDLVFIPGLDARLLLTDEFMRSCSYFQEWLQTQFEKKVTICSVCTGTFLLAEAGLLDKRNCTTHWKYMERFANRYPKAKLLTNRLFVEDDGIYTSAGVSSGIDLALHMIEKIWGGHFAAQIAKEVVVYFRRSIDDPQLSIFTQYRNHMEHRIHKVQERLSQTLYCKISIEELAAGVNMSPRNLTRLFKKTTQLSIGNYIDLLRAGLAQQLMKEGQTLQFATTQCGLKSTNQLRHIIRKYGAEQAG